MKLRRYNGHLKSRKDLEIVLQERLPRKAKVLFAYLSKKPVPMPYGPPGQQEDLLAFWQVEHLFLSVHGLRRCIPNEISGEMEYGQWMFPQETRINPKTFLSGLTDERVKWPEAWNNLKDAIREVAAQMVEIEQEWALNPEENEVILASERHAPRRN